MSHEDIKVGDWVRPNFVSLNKEVWTSLGISQEMIGLVTEVRKTSSNIANVYFFGTEIACRSDGTYRLRTAHLILCGGPQDDSCNESSI